MGDAGTKMPTTRVPAFRCGTDWSGWLHGAHPTVEDDIVHRKVCFSDPSSGCRYYTDIFVKNCESYFIYTLYIRASVVQTECEANIFRLARGLSNRSVGTYVYGFDM